MNTQLNTHSQKPMGDRVVETSKLREDVYVFLCVFFSGIILVGNMTYQKFVYLDVYFYTFELSVGAITYPISFVISDLLAEFYGKAYAQRALRSALLMNIIAAFVIHFMNNLESTTWSKVDNRMFSQVFGNYNVAFFGSLIACYISQNIDVNIYLIIKRLTNGRFLWIRNSVSTAISLLIDTSIVVLTLGIFGAIDYNQIFPLIYNSYGFKLFFIVLNIPVFYLIVFLLNLLRK